MQQVEINQNMMGHTHYHLLGVPSDLDRMTRKDWLHGCKDSMNETNCSICNRVLSGFCKIKIRFHTVLSNSDSITKNKIRILYREVRLSYSLLYLPILLCVLSWNGHIYFNVFLIYHVQFKVASLTFLCCISRFF